MAASRQQPDRPPEAALIRRARLARGFSVADAVRALPIQLSASRWYHIEAGREGRGKTVRAPASTLAHMAHLVGVTPDDLAQTGEENAIAAADILQEMERQGTVQPDAGPTAGNDPNDVPEFEDNMERDLWEMTEDKQEAWQLIFTHREVKLHRQREAALRRQQEIEQEEWRSRKRRGA